VSETGTPLGRTVRAMLAQHPKVGAWQIRSVRRNGYQTYLVQTELETDRYTEGETCEATILVKNEALLGRAVVTLGPGDESRLSRRIDDAVYMAGLGGDAPWSLPEAGEWPRVETHDPTLSGTRARATSREVAEAWRAAVRQQKGVRPSSMELFCGEEVVSLENSAGLVATASATRISLLTLVLADGEHPSERYSWEERRRVADLDVREVVRRAAEEAADLTRATAPPSGQYAVVIDAEEMPAFLDPVQANCSGESLYQKASRFEIGKPLPIESKGGEPLTVVSNAVVPYGLSSYAFDGTGVAGQRVELVKDGVFARPWATKQYADYLATAPTGGFANWELPAGKTPVADLLAGAERVLYVRAFSWLSPDGSRGNFASEIRLGYVIEKGARTPVKGGTVSGNVFAALGTARYARETVFRGEYMGPVAVRFEGLTIAGA
jgi:predicted Zn-dependent protease